MLFFIYNIFILILISRENFDYLFLTLLIVMIELTSNSLCILLFLYFLNLATPFNYHHKLYSNINNAKFLMSDSPEIIYKNDIVIEKKPCLTLKVFERLNKAIKYYQFTYNVPRSEEFSGGDIYKDSSKPTIAFINRKSGGLLGSKLIAKLQNALSSKQVCDLQYLLPLTTLNHFKNTTKDIPFHILCCGGDGTIGWIMDDVYASGLYNERNITYGIIPLGTGNDLHQHIKSICKDKYAYQKLLSSDVLLHNTSSILNAYTEAHDKIHLDRWKVSIQPKLRRLTKFVINDLQKKNKYRALDSLKNMIPRDVRIAYRLARYEVAKLLKSNQNLKQIKMMNNYLGIGVDGEVAMHFAEFRKAFPLVFFSQLINKIWYAVLGLLTFLLGKKYEISRNVNLKCDGSTVIIPQECRGIIVSNIQSYAGGSKLWVPNLLKWQRQYCDDGIIEVSKVLNMMITWIISPYLSLFLFVGCRSNWCYSFGEN